jgi:hypothetical protein
MKRFLPVVLFLAAALPFRASAEESLARGIPSDSFFFIHRRAVPDAEPIRQAFAGVARAFRDSGLAGSFLEVLGTAAGEEASEEETARLRRMVEGVEWGKLLEKEFAFSVRFETVLLDARSLESDARVDWTVLFRVDLAERDRFLGGLRKLLLALATIEEPVGIEGVSSRPEVVEGDREGVPTTILASPTGETRLCLSGRGDVIAVSSSSWELRRSLQLLAGEGSGRAIIETDDYTLLLAGLPAPRSGRLILRPSLVFAQLREMAAAVEKAPVESEKAAGAEEAVRVLGGLCDALDLVKGIGVSETVEGRKVVETFQVLLQEDAAKRSFHGALFDRPAIGDIGRLVPATASSFEITSSFDLAKLHDAVIDLVRRVAPEGRLAIDSFREEQETIGIDLKRDVLSLIEGRIVLLTFPPAVAADAKDSGEKTRAGSDDLALFLRLKDPARAEARIAEWLGKAREGLRAAGLETEDVQLPGVDGKFRKVSLPFFPGMGLTFGVSGDELAIGSSGDRLREAILARAGKFDGLDKIAGFTGLGLGSPPPDELSWISYGNARDLLAQVRAALDGVGLLGKLSSEAGGDAGKKFLDLAPRLGKAIDALPFLDRCGGYMIRDGKAYRGKFVLEIRPAKSF